MVTLRQIREEDLPFLMEWRMDPEITRYMNTDPQLTLEGQKIWLERITADETSLHWAIEVDGELAGMFQMMDLANPDKCASWGYYIGNRKARSLATALSLEMSMYDFAFDVLGLERMHNDVFTANAGVIRLHQACGCEVERIVPGEIVKNGVAYDVAHSYISAAKWREIRGSKKYEKISFEDIKKS